MSNVGNEKPTPSKKKRKSNKKEELLQEQERLEKIVFGKQHGLFNAVGKTSTGETESAKIVDECLEVSTDESKKAAWVDEDDLHVEIPSKQKKYATTNSEDSYQNLLRRRYQQTVGNPRWASKKEAKPVDSDDEDINETMRCGNLINKKSKSLSKGTIVVQEEKDLNVETKIEGREINAVEFHPTSTFTAALVAGNSGRASIIQVDGNNNSKLLTVQFQGFHVDCAHFSKDGDQFFVGSRSSRNFYYYDLIEGKSVQVTNHHAIGQFNMSNFHVSPDGKHIVVCGKDGDIHLLDAKNKEWIKSSMKMNTDVVDVTFNNDGSTMYSYGENGEIFEWDMNTRYCVNQMREQGSLQGITIALSKNNQILATGSSFGIANLYEMPLRTKIIEPKKVIDNLRTSITSLQFNSSSEILAIASSDTKNAVKLIHFPSMTVFSNFPKFQTNIGIPRVMSFSPSSGYFAIGNNEGRALLYRLKHYKNS